MLKCNTVKNPCKICLEGVTQKSGLQCQGACKSWVHYKCLNYTPGKLSDIKKKIITVTCPCPDCLTTSPKEIRNDGPFSCDNDRCPANRPPKCVNNICPNNSGQPPRLEHCTTKDCKKHGSDSVNYNTPITPPPPCSTGCSSGGSSAHDIPGDRLQGGRGGGSNFPLEAMEQVCNTVGQLATQITNLMCKMKQAAEGGGGSGSPTGGGACTQPGPKALCPKPCYCPNNPGAKKR